MGAKENNTRQRDRPGMCGRAALWLGRWGADCLLAAGALLVSVGIGWVYPPAGVIAGGVLLIAGGVLWARGGGAP